MAHIIDSTIIGLLKNGIAGLSIALAASAAGAEQVDLLLQTESRRSAEVSPGIHPARFNAAALSLALGNEARLTLGGTAHTVVFDRRERHPNGDTTWVGHLKDHGDDYRVIVTHGAAGSFGRILTPDGEFLLHAGPDGGLLIDPRRAGVEELPTCGNLTRPNDGQASAQAPRAMQKSAPTVIDVEGNLDIDLLIVYTPGMARNYPGDALQTRLNHLVSLANQAYIDSKVGITLRLVHSAQVEYSDTVSNRNALADLNSMWEGKIGRTASELREQYGADLVSLIRPYNKASGQSCGIAEGWGSYSRYGVFRGSATSVVSDRLDTDSNIFGCSDYALAHEIGHNMGSVHDRANADMYLDENGILVHTGEFGEGAFPFSYGYGKEGSFGTIMSYIRPRVGKFSNPAITCNGEPCGAAEDDPQAADNALSLNQTRFWVADYMPTGGTRSAFTDNGDGTATHVKTGLIWMRCAIGRYRWDGEACAETNSDGYYTYKQALDLTANFAGHTDWRVPSIHDLLSIVDWRTYPEWPKDRVLSIDNWWSATSTIAQFNPMAWYASSVGPGTDFQDGENYSRRYVHLVRGTQLQASDKFIDNMDGTITDKKTSLTWKHCIEGQTWNGMSCSGSGIQMSWIKAKDLTDDFAGKSDWRLPGIGELLTLVDFEKKAFYPEISASGKLWSVDHRYGLDGKLLTMYLPPGGSWELWTGRPITEQHFALLVRGTQTPPQIGSTASDAAQTSAIDINRLFNWAETKYADLFKPAMAATQTLSGYTYRSYGATGADLAVKDDRVYYRGSLTGGQIADVGAMADFLDQAKQDGF